MLNRNIHENCQFEIKNEYDLHCKVVRFLRKKYPQAILIPCMGELQDTSSKRIGAYNRGYRSGAPDLLILHANEQYNGMAIEFKNPCGTGRLSSKQEDFLNDLHYKCDYQVLVSNDYDEILMSIIEYMNIDA